jgi:transposase
VRAELAPYYPNIGRPSIDPELMIRMLIVGYVFAIRSERLLCREVKVNMAYRWFCGLSIEDKIRRSRVRVMSGFPGASPVVAPEK